MSKQTPLFTLTLCKVPTSELTPSQFRQITQLDVYPDYLQKDIFKDSIPNVYSNGEINYKFKSVHARVSVLWDFKVSKGAVYSHFSIMKGIKANLVIRQDEEQDFTPELYIEPSEQVKYQILQD